LKLDKFTIATWFRRTGYGITVSTGTGGITAEPLVTKGRGESDGSNVDMNYFFGIRQSDMVLAADFEDMTSGNNHPVVGTTTIENNTWYHAAATYDGNTWRLYLNGNLEAEAVENATPRYDCIQDNAIGSALNSTGTPEGYFKGLIEEVSIWDQALDSVQIRENMYLRLSTIEFGLTGYWQFNEASGTTAYDCVGGNQGTLVNMDTNNCWVNSTIPLGDGASNTQTETSDTVNFTGTGLSMYFNSQNGVEITVTRIDTTPNIIPANADTVFDAQYWVVNRFGSGTFDANLTFTLAEDLTSSDENNPTNIQLYTRVSNSTDVWAYLNDA